MMSEQEFGARLTHIEDQATAMQQRVDGWREQHLARLFVDSGWSQQELADYLGKRWGKEVSRQWVGYHLLFGRFLLFFATTGGKENLPATLLAFRLPANLTERGFRAYWDRTEAAGDFRGHKANTEAAAADERRRFVEIALAMVGGGVCPRRPKALRAPLAEHASGKWLTAREMADRITPHVPPGPTLASDVQDALSHWQSTAKVPYRVERASVGGQTKYRILRIKGQVVSRKQVAQIAHELVPMVDELLREAQKGRTEMSLAQICSLASRIRQVVTSVAAEVPEAKSEV